MPHDDLIHEARELKGVSVMGERTWGLIADLADALEARPSLVVRGEEELARGICAADEPTLDYERRYPDYDDEPWQGYLEHARALIASGTVTVAPSLVAESREATWLDDDLYGVIDRAMQRSWTDVAEYEYAPSEITSAVRTWMDEQCFRRWVPAEPAVQGDDYEVGYEEGFHHGRSVPALVARVRELEAGIKSALDVAGSSSVPLGVTEARHWDRLLAETRRVLFSALEGATDDMA